MKTAAKLGGTTLALLLLWGCGASRSTTSATDDTYLTAKERAQLSQNKSTTSSSSGDVDAREDNYESSERATQAQRGEDDYCYSCRVRRYSTGVWYDPWMDPWYGWNRSAWCGPGWGGWTPGWSYSWAWRPGWYYTPGWGWTYYSGYWGPTYYAGPGWSYWNTYYDPYWGWGASSTPSRRYNYTPRTYTSPRGTTTYTPPRGTIVTPSGTPPRRSATPTSPSRPTYTPSTGGGRSTVAPSGGRPSSAGGMTGGGIRSSGAGGARPR
ncbi:MAG: hypothetical protein N3A68_01950 [Bacteroidia bacterium]|nr:hypothetical protein [Bacteroidia bacterium]GIV23303.1 MAG: hypothetical protein KatS3mg025_0962 [Bacteroidia bacterium]